MPLDKLYEICDYSSEERPDSPFACKIEINEGSGRTTHTHLSGQVLKLGVAPIRQIRQLTINQGHESPGDESPVLPANLRRIPTTRDCKSSKSYQG